MKALIFGVTGQDGAYLARHLLHHGYTVVGAYRRSATDTTWRLDVANVLHEIELHPVDMTEFASILRLIEKVEPSHVFNLAAQSFVRTSFEVPMFTSDVTALGALRVLEAIRQVNPAIRYYQASSSEQFGDVIGSPQDEQTPFNPRSPYGVSKVFAHHMTVNYREAYGIHACCGILFNHESPLRGTEFVTRKVTSELARWAVGNGRPFKLGNLDARRDWGHAADYVVAMKMILEFVHPHDYVIATGKTHTVRELVSVAAEAAGLDFHWNGDLGYIGMKEAITVDRNLYRPSEVWTLHGNANKARHFLGWSPTYSFTDLIGEMVRIDIHRAESEGTICLPD